MAAETPAWRIARSPDAVAVDGIRACSLDALVATVPSLPWLVSDLSMGGWLGHAAATQMGTALGLPTRRTPARIDGFKAKDEMPSYADVIGAAIDAEAAGEGTVLAALGHATCIAASLAGIPARAVLVLAPRFGLPWEPEDALFVSLLARALRGTQHHFALVAADAEAPEVPSGLSVVWRGCPEPGPVLADGYLLPLVPGVLEPALVTALRPSGSGTRTWPLGNGLLLVAPECRLDPRRASRFDHDRLAQAAAGTGWLRAFARYYGNNHFVNSLELCGHAWERTREGGMGIALRLLERAIECASSSSERARCFAQTQGLRIATQQFAAAAAAPDPPPSAPPEIRAFLWQSKGWGLAMEGDPALADRHLARARALADPSGRRREYLYLLNISALARLKTGDIDGAFEFERYIEAELSAFQEPDAHLEFINAINLARLYRRIGAWDDALQSYERAFATVRGVRSESDAVYENVCSALVETERAQPRAAFPFLLRAALHWVSCEIPEALPRRAVWAVLARRPGAGENRTEAVSSALASRLLTSACAAIAGMAEPDVSAAAPGFGRSCQSEAPLSAIDRIVAGPGFSVLVNRSTHVSPFDGPEHRRLRRLLYAILTRLAPKSRLCDDESFVVDDRLGREMALHHVEVLETAIRVGAASLVIDGQMTMVNPTWRARAEISSQVRLGPAVTKIVGDCLHFRRCRQTWALSDVEARLIRAIADAPDVPELASRLGVDNQCALEQVRVLERQRAVTLALSEA